MLISLSLAVEPVARWINHGVCDARPTVTFPACAGTKFILLGDVQLAAQDINSIAYTRLNSLDLTFVHRPGIVPRSVRTLARSASTYLA